MPSLAHRVLSYIRKQELLKPGDRVGAAVSGGADSVAMLRLLLELRQEIGIVLSVVHFDHRLRGEESDGDQQFVAELARGHQLEFHVAGGDVTRHAAEKRLSLETGARELRYAYFWQLLGEGGMNRIATAHTRDDQAETVMMRVARGAGTRGLAGIYPKLRAHPSAEASVEDAAIVRPMLATRRREVESYLKSFGQDWREDSSNRDLRHTRNRMRHGILPQLEQVLNPAICEVLGETAEIARAEQEYWDKEVSRLLPTVWADDKRSLRSGVLLNLPLALQRRLIRAAGESLGLMLEFGHVAETLEVCAGNAKSAELAGGWRVVRRQNVLHFEPPVTKPAPDLSYQYCLRVPGAVAVPEASIRLQAVLISANDKREESGERLDPEALGPELLVRNWQPGDRFWPAHTKNPRKIKELLQEKHVTGPSRQLWPVLMSGPDVVWLRGFRSPAGMLAKTGADGILIQESPL